MADEQLFNEQSLYYEIVSIWGEHGAHADVYKELCKRAGIEIKEASEDYSMERRVKRIYEEEGRNKIRTIKRFRAESETGLGLKAAMTIVEKYV